MIRVNLQLFKQYGLVKKYEFPVRSLRAIFSQIKNVNYEAENISYYKDETTNEVFGALGFLSKIDFFKQAKNEIDHFLTPKVLRYAPGHTRKQDIDDGTKLETSKVWDLDRLNSFNNFEKGMSASIGFDYQMDGFGKQLDFSMGQIFNKEENNDAIIF